VRTMTEIKKATIDDVDVSKFQSFPHPAVGAYNTAMVIRRAGAIELHSGYQFSELSLRMRRHNYGWRTSGTTPSEPCWMRYAFDVADEFEAWLVAELARIDREREEAAKPKMPTVKAPEGCQWRIDEDGDVCLVDKYGENWCVIDHEERDQEHQLECDIATIKARAEALGKRIVVLDEAEKCFAIATAVWPGKEL
jgi:hypothetical protein